MPDNYPGAAWWQALKRDLEAIEALRFASLKRGWKWQWDGMDLIQVHVLPGENVHKDPVDAILGQPYVA